ncbi:E3 ubiquitin-protein ligase Topors-like [Megalops cyprinoides]|uniref:E3 ubiquitin-protein ligase Topors-like n=1 Tax=Megalops cyprinoides TaxID=118141 RepID=UPI001864C940|nr:E3 ubiquitin-protein ligase Topors-like [Megalops cyprinoides]
MMAPTKMKLRMRKKDGPGKASQTVSAEASPDSKCPICLDRFNNMAYLDHCLHKFCFRCIHEWSKNKAECPLCKQPFNSIFHTVKAENDFKEFVLRPTENGSFSSPGAHRLRYGATQTRERRQSPRRTSPPPDNGVIFEGLSGSTPLQQDRGVHRMMMRLAARRRAQSKGRTVRHLREQEMVTFRRALYRTGVRVRSVRDGGRHRDISAAFFQRNPACLHRLLPWLKRELTVLYGTHGSLVNIVQHIIMSRITRYDMEDQAIQDELRPFLLTRTDHFLHEFISFARSPFNMEAYDQHAIYDCPAPSYEEGSSSDSSVIAISEDEGGSVERDQRPVSVAGSALSQAPWDDETPGPSYSTTEQPRSPSLSVSESESESSREGAGQPEAAPQEGAQVKADPAVNEDGGASSFAEEEEEDCVIVGYVKPMAERTPELVQLSSDSEESVHDANENPEVPQQPQHIRFPSLSPPSSACSSASKRKSPQREALSAGSFQQADKDLPSLEARERHSASHKGNSPADRGGTSGVTDRSGKYHTGGSRSHNKDERRHHRGSRERSRSRSRDRSRKSGSRWSRSTERSWSARSPTISVHSDSTLSRGRRHSRSRSGERPPSKDRARDKRRERDGGRRRHGRERSSYKYHWDSYSREKESSDPLYVPSRSYCSSLYTSPEYDSRSRSRSPQDPRDPRDLPHLERRRSSSLSGASSQGSHAARRRSRHEKPSGKRKYKTRHLEGSSKERPSRAPALPPSPPSSGLRERGAGERHHRRSRRKSRSPSVEIIFEGRATAETRRHHKKKKKHRKRSRRHKSRERAECRSPTVITIDSDTDHTVDITDPAVDVGDRAGLVSGKNEVSTTTGHPSDAHLLESILQDLEEHILPVDQDSAAGASHTDAASSQVAFDIDKCNTPHSENKHSSVSSDDETSTGSPLITIESQFIEQTSLEDAPDISAVGRTD